MSVVFSPLECHCWRSPTQDYKTSFAGRRAINWKKQWDSRCLWKLRWTLLCVATDFWLHLYWICYAHRPRKEGREPALENVFMHLPLSKSSLVWKKIVTVAIAVDFVKNALVLCIFQDQQKIASIQFVTPAAARWRIIIKLWHKRRRGGVAADYLSIPIVRGSSHQVLIASIQCNPLRVFPLLSFYTVVQLHVPALSPPPSPHRAFGRFENFSARARACTHASLSCMQ